MLTCAASLLAATAAFAQDDGPSKTDLAAMAAARAFMNNGDYVGAAAILRTAAFDAAGQPVPGFAYDRWVEAQTLMHGEPPPNETPGPPVPPDDAARLRAATPRDAIAEIVARARKTRIVILNEDHGSPRTRAFGLEVARALRPLGYDVLAAEAFSNEPDDAKSAAMMTRIARAGYLHRTDGYYIKDPVFAGFIRQALALGYRPVAYETTDYSPEKDEAVRLARREQMQAEYLVTRVLKRDPHAKLFIFVGHGHVAEEPVAWDPGPPSRMMANRLKALTGIDPLTIDQTMVAERRSRGPSPAYALIANRAKRRSIVPFLNSKPVVIGTFKGVVDLQVVHPRTRYSGGRQDWRIGMGGKPSPVPQYLLPSTGTRLIQAYIVDEGDDTMPVDQVLVTAGKPPPTLLLPEAKVRFVSRDVPQ